MAKKGHFSKIGVVFVISTDIGEVLDYDFVVCFAMNPSVIMQEKVMMTLIIGITNIKSIAKKIIPGQQTKTCICKNELISMHKLNFMYSFMYRNNWEK